HLSHHSLSMSGFVENVPRILFLNQNLLFPLRIVWLLSVPFRDRSDHISLERNMKDQQNPQQGRLKEAIPRERTACECSSLSFCLGTSGILIKRFEIEFPPV